MTLSNQFRSFMYIPGGQGWRVHNGDPRGLLPVSGSPCCKRGTRSWTPDCSCWLCDPRPLLALFGSQGPVCEETGIGSVVVQTCFPSGSLRRGRKVWPRSSVHPVERGSPVRADSGPRARPVSWGRWGGGLRPSPRPLEVPALHRLSMQTPADKPAENTSPELTDLLTGLRAFLTFVFAIYQIL